MRNLTIGNKMNFTIFTIIVITILVILVSAVIIVMNTEKEEYTVSSTACIYDKDYNYIELENDGIVTKKWTGNYYLKENVTKNEYELGNYAVVFDKNKKMLDLFGTFYQVLKGGDISKLTGYNTVNSNTESKFYKIEDRKYLIVAPTITNDSGSLSTSNYLIVIVDKLGNAFVLNNEINAKTINEMIINTDDFMFDVANEILIYDDENIDLAKILGSTNEYVQVSEEVETEEKEDDESKEQTEKETNATEETSVPITTPTTVATNTSIIETTENNSTTNIIQNGGSATTTEQDTSWVSALNDWIQQVAAGFQSIYNGNSNSSKEDSSLNKSITLVSLSSGTTYIDINYTVIDPESKYNVVYATITDGVTTYSVSLDKKETTYRLSGLNPNTNYSVDIGYKIIYSDSTEEENIEDTMTVRTISPTESLAITKVSLTKIYYELTLDSSFVYDSGAKLVIYLNDSLDVYQTIELTDSNLEKAASSSYIGSFEIPDEYKNVKNTSVTIKLEDTTYSGTTVDTGLMAKIVNY